MNNVIKLADVRAKREEIYRIGKIYGVSNIRIFGSLARNSNTPASDLDLLVTLDHQHTLLDLGGFLSDLEDLFHCKVDVIADDSIHSSIMENILKDAVAI